MKIGSNLLACDSFSFKAHSSHLGQHMRFTSVGVPVL